MLKWNVPPSHGRGHMVPTSQLLFKYYYTASCDDYCISLSINLMLSFLAQQFRSSITGSTTTATKTITTPTTTTKTIAVAAATTTTNVTATTTLTAAASVKVKLFAIRCL